MIHSKQNTNSLFTLLSIFLIILLSDTAAYSQAPSVIWSKIWSGAASKDDYGVSCCSDGSGYLYVTGTTTTSSNYPDVVTIKYNQSTGDTVWVKTYGTAGKDDGGYGCCLSNDGYLYVTGYTDIGTSQDDYQFLLLKYNAVSGALVYAKNYGSPTGTEMGTSCAFDGTNIYATSRRFNGTYWLMVLFKFNSSGDTLWYSYNANTSNEKETYGCSVDNAGNVYTTCYERFGTIDRIALSKYSSSGDLLWKKYSADAKETGLENPMTSCTISGNNVFVTGLAGDSLNSYGITIKYNSSGDTLWSKRNDSPSNYDQNNRCKADSQGDVYVCAARYNGTNDDWVMLKYKGLDGTLLWSIVYNHTGNNSDYAVDCALDNTGNLYATGFVNLNLGNSDIYTVKYQSSVGIINVSEIIPDKYSLSQNYPNPFNPSTVIRFEVPGYSDVVIKVYDINGREVKTPVNERMGAGTYEVNFEGTGLTSGVYFYKMTAGNFYETKRMILMK